MRGRAARQFIPVAMLVMLGACARGPALSEGVGAMRTSLAQARTQTDSAFTDINASRRDFAIQDVLDAKRAPADADFAAVIDSDTIGRWHAAFGKLDDYLAALQDLVGTTRSAQTATSLTAIGTALQSDMIGATLPRGSAELFAALGGALVQASAEKKALGVMRRTDPQVAALMRRMGDLVYGPGNGTLSALVRTQWQRRLRDIAANDYGKVADKPADERTPAVRAYAKAYDEREAKLAALASLRDGLLALGEAHAAAARGNDGAILYWIGQIDDRLKDVRKAIDAGEK